MCLGWGSGGDETNPRNESSLLHSQVAVVAGGRGAGGHGAGGRGAGGTVPAARLSVV